MRKVLTITALLMAALLVFSCANGGGSDSDNSPVKVSFRVETPQNINKIVSVDDADGAPTLTYWYKAVPQWTGVDFTTIQGSTNNAFVQINSYAPNKDIGLFAQGSWKFYAQVKSGDTVVYESAADPAITYINVSNTSVTLDVTRTTGNNAGSADISISIDAHDLSGVGSMTMTYTGLNSPITLNKAAHATKANWSTYTYTLSDLAAGSYVFTFTSAAGAAGANPVGGAVLAFDVLAGFDKEITGTIENGVWQTTLITINVPTLEVTLTGAESVAKNANTTFTCTATSANLADRDVVKFEWFVDTASKGAATAGTEDPQVAGKYISTYSFSQANPGQYYVTCKASVDGKLIVSKTAKVTVTN